MPKHFPRRKREPKPEAHRLRTYLILPAIPAVLLGLFCALRGNRAVMDFLITYITTPYKTFVSGLLDPLPWLTAEWIWLFAILAGIAYLVRWIVLLVRRGDRLRRCLRRSVVLVSVLALVYCGYTLFWGINYYGTTFTERSGLTRRGATAEELYSLCCAFVEEANRLAPEMPRDEEGVFSLEAEEIFALSDGLFDGICEEYPFLEAPERTPKGMLCSRLCSYIGFTGFYFPFTAEACLNIDAPSCLLPVTTAHELSHQRGVTDEDEANFAAILTCMRCDNDIYRYSGCLLAYIHLGNALYKADEELWSEMHDLCGEEVLADMRDNTAYWNEIESSKPARAAKSTADKVYNSFTSSYGETDVLQRYEACVELLVSYYFDGE